MTGVDIPVIAQRTLNENSGDRAQAMRYASSVANEMLKSGAIPNLNRAFAAERAEEIAMIASLWDGRIEVQPYIIGDMVEDMGSGLRMSWAQRVRAYPKSSTLSRT